MSLSARRAWIEIRAAKSHPPWSWGALRKESVDRNLSIGGVNDTGRYRSLSARRAWIEIYTPQEEFEIDEVALRKESVDRNRDAGGTESIYNGRSPQGERG